MFAVKNFTFARKLAIFELTLLLVPYLWALWEVFYVYPNPTVLMENFLRPLFGRMAVFDFCTWLFCLGNIILWSQWQFTLEPVLRAGSMLVLNIVGLGWWLLLTLSANATVLGFEVGYKSVGVLLLTTTLFNIGYIVRKESK